MTKRTTILLVEDSPDDVELTIRAMRKSEVESEVVVARDGVEALEYLFAEGEHSERDMTDLPQVVLLDLKLPKVDGLEVLRRVRNDERTRFVPVVILTSSDEERDMVDGYKFGANSYVRKPVDYLEFASAVRKLEEYWLQVNLPVSTKVG